MLTRRSLFVLPIAAVLPRRATEGANHDAIRIMVREGAMSAYQAAMKTLPELIAKVQRDKL